MGIKLDINQWSVFLQLDFYKRGHNSLAVRVSEHTVLPLSFIYIIYQSFITRRPHRVRPYNASSSLIQYIETGFCVYDQSYLYHAKICVSFIYSFAWLFLTPN